MSDIQARLARIDEDIRIRVGCFEFGVNAFIGGEGDRNTPQGTVRLHGAAVEGRSPILDSIDCQDGLSTGTVCDDNIEGIIDVEYLRRTFDLNH